MALRSISTEILVEAGFGIAHADAEGVGADVGHDDVLERPRPPMQADLHGGAEGDRGVRIEMDQRHPPEQARDEGADHRHPRRPADEHHRVEGGGIEPRIGDGALHRRAQAAQERSRLSLEGIAAERAAQRPVAGDEFVGFFGAGGERHLHALRLPAQARRVGRRQGPRREAMRPRDHLLDDGGEVVTAEAGVAGRRAHLHDALVLVEDRDVESAAAEVEDEEQPVGALGEAVGERRRGGLVDEAVDGEPGEAPGIEGRLALMIVEVGRDRDDRFLDGLAESRLRVFPQGAQDKRRKLLRPEALWAEADLLGGAHQALEGGDAAVRPRQQEVAGGAADDDRAVVVDADRRGRQNLAEGIGDEAGPRLRENGDEGVRGAEIDAADRQEKPRRFARGL